MDVASKLSFTPKVLYYISIRPFLTVSNAHQILLGEVYKIWSTLMPLATTSALLQEISFSAAPRVLDLALGGSETLRFAGCEQKADIKIHLDHIYTPAADVFLVRVQKKKENNISLHLVIMSWLGNSCGSYSLFHLGKKRRVMRGESFQFYLTSPYPHVTFWFYRRS